MARASKGRIAILCAEALELAALEERLEIVGPSVSISGISIREAVIGGREVVLAQAGVGKVNATLCSEAVILSCQPTSIIVAGVAGALRPQLEIGDIVISSHVAQYDFDLRAFRRALGEVPLVRELVERDVAGATARTDVPWSTAELSRRAIQLVKADRDLVRTMCAAYEEAHESAALTGCYVGVVASGDRFVSKQDDFYVGHLALLRSVFGALCVEMEGAAVGYTARMNEIPFVVVRGITDKADGTAVEDFERNLRTAASGAASVVATAIGTMGVAS